MHAVLIVRTNYILQHFIKPKLVLALFNFVFKELHRITRQLHFKHLV